jgi:DNA-binding NarL/FixJ family response regulator
MAYRLIMQNPNGISKARVIVADDHPIYGDGMASLLHEIDAGFDISCVVTFDAVLAAAKAGSAPKLFVLDLNFPGMSLPGSITTLRGTYPKASIVIVSMTDDQKTADKVMGANADGFISKSAAPDAMKNAIIKLLNGEFVTLCGSNPTLQIQGIDADYPGLTTRQKDVLRLLVDGKANKEIARDLGISPFTVRLHVSALFRQLGVVTRAAAAVQGARYML